MWTANIGCVFRVNPTFSKETYRDSLLRIGSMVSFFGGEDPLSNVSAVTGIPVTAESAGGSGRCRAQDGRHPGEAIFCALLVGVSCVAHVSKNGVQDFNWRLNDVED